MSGHYRPDSYTALDGRQIVYVEKRGSIDSDGSGSSYYSSRNVSDSQQIGLLSKRRLSSPGRLTLASLAINVRRRRFSRYFTIVLAAALIGTFITLGRLKHVSEAKVRIGWKKPPPTWEEFPFLERYYGGVQSIVTRSSNKPEYPDPERELEFGRKDNATESATVLEKRDAAAEILDFNPLANTTSQAEIVPCFLDESRNLTVPHLRMHNGVPQGMPDSVIGSYDILGLENTGCFDRYGRLAPYGLGYSKLEGGTGAGTNGAGVEEATRDVWGEQPEIHYGEISWAAAQDTCIRKNAHRFKTPHRDSAKRRLSRRGFGFKLHGAGDDKKKDETDVDGEKEEQAQHGRTAILIRTWTGYEYDAEDILYLRAMINELVLHSGGEYTVHFLVHVKDDNLQIWSDEETYNNTLHEALPLEFQGMGTLWSERQMSLIYSGLDESLHRDLPVHSVYRSTWMPVQYFAQSHPEYDFFWNWEMDVRFIGHYYHFLDRVSTWTREQPRKGLWERNSRFYVPTEHGSWEDFSHMARVQTEHGTSHTSNLYHKVKSNPATVEDALIKPETPVWGPLGPVDEADRLDNTTELELPGKQSDDKGEWGVGEDADLITFNPLFNPEDTDWILRDDVTGYQSTPPRRTSVTTTSRLGKRLLSKMHRETSLKRHTMSSEMWPGSIALHHGLKAVYAPHPVYIDRRWPTSYLAAIFNNGRNGASGGARTSIFSDDRQHNFLGTTWYYHAGFPQNLWKRWLGYKVDGKGGEIEEKAGEGRMCLPAMLLHPVKHVNMIIE